MNVPAVCVFSFQTFYFIFGYKWLTIWQFQVDNKGTQSYIYMHPCLPNSHPVQVATYHWAEFQCYRADPCWLSILNIALCTHPSGLPNYPFPHPSPQAIINLFSESVQQFLFCKLVQMFMPFSAFRSADREKLNKGALGLSLSIDTSEQSHCWTWCTVLISSKGLKPNNTYDELTWSMPPIQKNSLHSWGLQGKKKFQNFNFVGNFGS